MLKFIWRILLAVILITGSSVQAARQNPGPWPEPGGKIEIKNDARDLIKLTGEIVAISESGYTLRRREGLISGKFAPDLQIFCNGLPGIWEALLPVAAGAYFEAELLVNRTNEALQINAFYLGEEVVIKSWSDHQGRLLLHFDRPDHHDGDVKWIAAGARLPRDNWLQPGQTVFILYNFQGKIRAVFLPD